MTSKYKSMQGGATMNTIEDLKNDICYCLKKEKKIKIQECTAPECSRFKGCMKKSNKELK